MPTSIVVKIPPINLAETLGIDDTMKLEKQGAKLTKKIAKNVYRKWKELAIQTLGSTKDIYTRALVIRKTTIGRDSLDASYTHEVALTSTRSELALKIEEGSPPFDLKPLFRQSKKIKIPLKNPGGWYLDIPFRFFTPGANRGPRVLPGPVYRAVRRGQPIPKPYAEPRIRKEIRYTTKGGKRRVKFGAYRHKTSIYTGLQKRESGPGGYGTFRRVSNNSDPLAWIHPGFRGEKLAEKTVQEVDIPALTDKLVREIAENLG